MGKKAISLTMALLTSSMMSVTSYASTGEEVLTPLTPSGNLSLVDDIKVSDEVDKQFITVQSKDGNYFYIVIDRSGETENVYMMNLIDEADLYALAKGEKVPLPEVEVEPEVTVKPTEPEEEKESEAEKEVEEKSGSIMPLILLVGLACVGGFAYFSFFKKDKKSSESQVTRTFDDEPDIFGEEQEDIDIEVGDIL